MADTPATEVKPTATPTPEGVVPAVKPEPSPRKVTVNGQVIEVSESEYEQLAAFGAQHLANAKNNPTPRSDEPKKEETAEERADRLEREVEAAKKQINSVAATVTIRRTLDRLLDNHPLTKDDPDERGQIELNVVTRLAQNPNADIGKLFEAETKKVEAKIGKYRSGYIKEKVEDARRTSSAGSGSSPASADRKKFTAKDLKDGTVSKAVRDRLKQRV